jgi:hypothetical protein
VSDPHDGDEPTVADGSEPTVVEGSPPTRQIRPEGRTATGRRLFRERPEGSRPRAPLAGFMSVPVHPKFPIRRSTLLMAVAFAGFAVLLSFYPPQSTTANSSGSLIQGPDGKTYFVPNAVPVSTTTTTTTTVPTATTRPPIATTTIPLPTTTTTFPRSTTTTTTVPPTTTTTTTSGATTTTTTRSGVGATSGSTSP